MPFGCDAVTGMPGESVYGPDNRRVAEILFGSLREYEEHKANARLIAAAPDLLHALEEAVKAIENCERHVGLLVGERHRLEQARAAIAKATAT